MCTHSASAEWVNRARGKLRFGRRSKRHRTRSGGANSVEADAAGDCSGGVERQMRLEMGLKMVVVWCHEAGELSLNCGVQRELIFG